MKVMKVMPDCPGSPGPPGPGGLGRVDPPSKDGSVKEGGTLPGPSWDGFPRTLEFQEPPQDIFRAPQDDSYVGHVAILEGPGDHPDST